MNNRKPAVQSTEDVLHSFKSGAPYFVLGAVSGEALSPDFKRAVVEQGVKGGIKRAAGAGAAGVGVLLLAYGAANLFQKAKSVMSAGNDTLAPSPRLGK